MTARPIHRFALHATVADLDKTDRVDSYATANAAITQAIAAHKSGQHLRVWVREHSIDPAILPKTIWRDGKNIGVTSASFPNGAGIDRSEADARKARAKP